jgi:hypothetical protein
MNSHNHLVRHDTYYVFGMNQIRTIDAIFEKGIGCDYNNDALLYQDILKHSIVIKNKSPEMDSFKFYELANWLLRNNSELVSYYDSTSTKRNTRYNIRIHAHRSRIQNKIGDLITLKLIEPKGTIKGDKNSLPTPVYSYTKFGYLLALIIKSGCFEKELAAEKRKKVVDKMKIADKEKEQQIVNNQIFSLLDTTFFKIGEDSSSTIVFYSHFFKKCRDKGVFDVLVQHISDVAHSNSDAKDMRELFKRVVGLGLKDERLRKDFMDLWNETLEGLDPKLKALVLFHMKLDAERRFQNSKEYLTKEYEEIRFKNRNNHDRIVVEGTCKKCGTGPIVLPYLEYRKRFALVGLNDLITLDCPICNTKNGLVICNFNIS